MIEIEVPLNVERSPEEEQTVNKLLVAGMYGLHREFNKLLNCRQVKAMVKRGALLVVRQ